MINLETAIKFPFTQKDWQTKLGLLFLFYLAVSFAGAMGNFDQQSTREMFEGVFRNGNFNPSYITPALDSLRVYQSIWLVILQFATIPLSLYLSGYEFSFTRNVMNKKKDALDEHNNIGGFIKLGFVKFLLAAPLTIIYFFFLVIALVVAFTMINAGAIGINFFQGAGVFGVLLFLLLIALLIVGGILLSLLNSSIYYNYLAGSGFWAALNPTRVIETFRKGWLDFLGVIGLQVVVGLGAGIVSLLLICFSFVAQPAITLFTQLVVAHLYGQAYQKLLGKK